MKKSATLAVRVLAAVLAYAALLMLAPAAFAAEAGSLDNFKATETYTEGQFTDVPQAWYAASVKTAYELGLMKGVGSGQFNPTGNISIMETIVLACRIHKTYYTGDGSFVQGKPWYQVYLDYAVANGIIVKDQYPDYQAKATRAVFAQVLAKALPAEALPVINRVDDDAIPDVSSSLPYAAPIYQLYRAGILTGGTDGAFSPAARIARSEAAAIAARMARPAERRSVTLIICTIMGHVWDDFTCTNPKTCTVCGTTVEAAPGHYWEDATCTKPKTCFVCGATEGTALGHTMDSSGTCIRCGETQSAFDYFVQLAKSKGVYSSDGTRYTYTYYTEETNGTEHTYQLEYSVKYDELVLILFTYDYSNDTSVYTAVSVSRTQRQYFSGMLVDMFGDSMEAYAYIDPATYTTKSTITPYEYSGVPLSMRSTYRDLYEVSLSLDLCTFSICLCQGPYTLRDLGFLRF